MTGGYLGVSVFFTLSGFLITRLLLTEHSATGSTNLSRFYRRRVLRLVPASALTLLAVIILARFGAFDGATDLRRDIVGASLQLGNWTQLTSGRSYADLFNAGSSPVEHYWSLGVEEQFYLLWPLLFAALASAARRTVHAVVLGCFAAFAFAAPVIATVWGGEAAYLSTPARMGEVLAGAALAVMPESSRTKSWIPRVSVVAAGVIVALFIVTPTDHGWAYSGGLPLFALLSVLIIAGALTEGPIRTVLSWRPLVGLGMISYGVYLVHWPIFLLVDAHRADVPDGFHFALKSTLTVVVAVLMHRLVERPFRYLSPTRATVPIGAAALIVMALLAFELVPPRLPSFGETDTATEQAAAIRPATGLLPDLLDDKGDQQRPVRILVVGDSTGEVVGRGLVEWAAANPTVAQVDNQALAGCGLVAGGRFGTFADFKRKECDRLVRTGIPAAYPVLRPDVVAISISAADTWDRQWDDGPMLRPLDPDYRERIVVAYERFLEQAVAAGVPHVVWIRPPVVGVDDNSYDRSYVDGSQALIEDVVVALTREHPEIAILDYRTWFEDAGLSESAQIRPDGVHLTASVAEDVATNYLGPELAGAALEDPP